MVELWVAHVYLTIFTFKAKVMRAATVRTSITMAATVSAIPNAVTLLDWMTGLAIPRALNKMGIMRKGGEGASGILHGPNLAG